MDIDQPVLLLTLAMLLALGTERLLELIRAVSDHFEARRPGSADEWRRKAEKLRDRIEIRLHNARSSASAFQMALFVVCRYLSPAPPESGGLIAIHADQLRTMTIRVQTKSLAVALGIVFAFVFGIDIFALVNQELQRQGPDLITLPAWLGKVLTGVAMGFGAGPVHAMITALEQARQLRK